MAKVTFVMSGGLVKALKRLARERTVGLAEIIRRAVTSYNFFMEELATGKEIRVFDPKTETYMVVNLK